ncbi:MAG TPA: hypothetical protein VH138_13035 [Vicinamibacterales bacterium]|nr:hypothetical protein [Vicinamibacterales bacterium]
MTRVTFVTVCPVSRGRHGRFSGPAKNTGGKSVDMTIVATK